MSTPRQLLAERIRKAAAKKRDAAAALAAVRDAGQGLLFNDDQVRILEVIGKQRGMGSAEFIAGCMEEIRPKLPPKATGEELLELIDQAVKNTQDQSRPRPSFSQEDAAKPRLSFSHGDKSVVKPKPKPSSGHWYADQSPSSRWADEVEEEERSQGRSFMQGRPSWNASLDQEADESFIRGAHRDPFLQVLDKLANRMDRPARPAPPAWPVFTDKYQDFPK